MAKKRKFGKRTRTLFRTAKRRFSKGTGQTQLIQPAAMAYGALRNPAANLVMPITHGVTGMLGEYEDEAVMLGAAWLAARFGSGFISSVGKAGLSVENANIGATFTKGISLGGSSAGSPSNGSGWV